MKYICCICIVYIRNNTRYVKVVLFMFGNFLVWRFPVMNDENYIFFATYFFFSQNIIWTMYHTYNLFEKLITPNIYLFPSPCRPLMLRAQLSLLKKAGKRLFLSIHILLPTLPLTCQTIWQHKTNNYNSKWRCLEIQTTIRNEIHGLQWQYKLWPRSHCTCFFFVNEDKI